MPRNEYEAHQHIVESVGPEAVRTIMRDHEHLFSAGKLKREQTRLLLLKEYEILREVGETPEEIRAELERIITRLASH